MCDYSLEHVASRSARVADRLVVTSFPNTLTRGFAAADDPNTAVCLLPGTEIAFDAPPRYRTKLWFGRKTAASLTARFRRVDRHLPHMHHDALEFADGTVLRLTWLVEKQRATVLQLPQPASEDTLQEQKASGVEPARAKVMVTEANG